MNVNRPLKNADIGTYLDVSTSHVTKADCEKLDKDAIPESRGFVVYKYPEGYFIHIIQDDPELLKETLEAAEARGYSEDFLNLVVTAHFKKCRLLRLDCDGTTYPELPTHEW